MGQRGELNLGQLVRERYGDDSVLIGFSTYPGTVTAAFAAKGVPYPGSTLVVFGTRVSSTVPLLFESADFRQQAKLFTVDMGQLEEVSIP